MKVLSAEQTREADLYTIQNEPVSSLNLMERASRLCTDWLLKNFNERYAFLVVCGTGNNGGDGLCIARQLAEAGRKAAVKIVRAAGNGSQDFLENLNRLSQRKDVVIEEYTASFSLRNSLGTRELVIVDAIFGSGLNREPEGIHAQAIAAINNAPFIRIAIDIPSGLYGEDNSANTMRSVVHANHTLTFQSPKLAFFFAENAPYIGEFTVLNIGLHPVFMAHVETPYHYVPHESIKQVIRERQKFGHKGTYGHVLLAAGSEGKTGAAILCSRAALRTGAGLVSAFVPEVSRDVMQEAVPEVMTITSDEKKFIGGRIPWEKYDALGLGPGLGTARETENSLKTLIGEYAGPMVWDADALNLLSDNKTWLAFIAPNTILTPHPGEFDRLTEKHNSGYARMHTQRAFAMKHGLIVVLKGAHTSVALPDGRVYFNSTGNPGMATAGSGDVLTGIITSLLAQGYSATHASIAGVYLHGLAGDIAAAQRGMESMIAGDIIEHLGSAFRMLHEK
jgi:ADP-dependent NAD(P)H-hydrate dehydratase / NAD(P)H-hydrate epimerase